jgi:hypothetical protein
MVKAKRPVVVLLALGLAVGAVAGCSKKDEPAPKAASQATEVKQLVDDTKRYAERLRGQPAGDRVSAAQMSKLTGLLDQLLRHTEEKAQASQQGGDVAKPEAQVVEDLKQLQEVQSALPAASGEGAPPAAGGEKPPLDLIRENLAKIAQVVQQGKDIVAMVRPSKGQPGGSSERGPAADEAQASELSQASTEPAATAPEPVGSSTGASSAAAPEIVAQAGAQPAPVTTGYSTVAVEAWPHNARLQVKVNGLLAGAYDRHISLVLDPFLKPGAINTITFTFNRPGSEVHLSVKAPGADQWIVVLKFASTKETLEDSFQVPFVGAKK